MPLSTPKHPFESSAKRLLKRVHICTQQSFEKTPSRHTKIKRKHVKSLSSTMSSGITLLNCDESRLVDNCTVISNSFAILNIESTEKKPSYNPDNITSSEASTHPKSSSSDFTIITMNERDVPAVIEIPKPIAIKVPFLSLLTRFLKPLTTKQTPINVKHINRGVNDIDRFNHLCRQQWITLSNFV